MSRTPWRRAVLSILSVLTGLTALVVPSGRPALADPPAGGMSGAQLTQLFADYGDTSGQWSGADSTASALLPDGRVAWLFSDTMLGTVNADHTRPRTSPMINNSIVTQDGSSLTQTVYGGTPSAPQSLIPPSTTGEWYWIGDSAVEGSTLKVLVNSYKRTGSGSLDFALTGTALATLALPGLTVTSVTPLALGSTIAWGSAVLTDGGYTYVYGSEYVAADGMRFAHLARVPAGGLAGAWQFWTGSAWSSDPAASARLLSGVGTAFGVQQVGGQYVLVTMESNIPFSAQAVAYTATSPTGPFTGPVDLFTAPEPAARQGVIVYDARVHPELAASGKLLVSYNVHSLNADDLYNDATIYRPRFVDVTWPPAVPDPASLPAAPADLTAAGDPTGSVTLSWPAVAGTGISYAVYQRDVTAGQTNFARVTTTTATSQGLGGFKNGHSYEFRITARTSAGEGAASPTRTVLVTLSPPPAPTGLAASAGTDGTVTLTWSAVPYAWRYTVNRRDVTAGEATAAPVNDPAPTDTTFTDATLTNGHTYEYSVTATHGGGDSPASSTVQATSFYAVPPAPGTLTATARADGQIDLSWSATSQNVYYLVFQRDVTAGETSFTQLPLPVTTCCAMTAGYLVNGHTYEFQVEASNQGGDSAPTNTAQAVSAYPATAPPGTLTATPGDGQVTLVWGASATSGSWYWVYQRDVTAGESTFTRLPLPISSCCTMTAGYLVNGHSYQFKVTATSAGAESAPSNTVSATPNVPLPGQVTGLTVTSTFNGELKLTWTAPGSNLYYWIYQRDVTAGEASFTKLPYPVGTCCTFTAGYLINGHTYQYKVAANNSAGDGPASAAVSGTAHYTPPPAPTGLTAVAAGNGAVDLDWNAPGPSLYYWLYIKDVTAGQTSFAKAYYPTDKTSFSWGSLVAGHAYDFKVSAENQGGEGPASSAVRVTVVGGQPQPPSNLTATAGDGQVTLHWTASPTANVYYVVEQRPAGGTWTRLPLPISTCCTMTAGYLTNGTTYEFRVRANNASGDSAATNVASAKPMPPLPQPASGLTATAGDGQVALHWTASPTANVSYWIEQRPSGGTWQRLPLAIACCSMTAGYLTNGTTYEFRVVATNMTGDASASNTASAKPMPPSPTAPTNLSASASGDTAAKLTWTASTTANVYYWIYYRLSGTSTWTKAQYPLSTCCTFTLSYLTPGKKYDFKLKAENLAGLSGDSNIASVTLTIITPGTPGSVKAVPQTTSSDVVVSWSAASNATGYTVQVKGCHQTSWSTVGFMITSTTWRFGYAAGCYFYRVQADRYGKYGTVSGGTVMAFGTIDDYPWMKGLVGYPWIDRYGFVRQQCTSFVAWRVYEWYADPDPPGFVATNYWNANNWDEAAAAHGGSVSHTPAVGAIAQWNAGQYGHVAWVAGIDGSYVIIEEYNYTYPEAYSRRRILASSVDNYLTVA